MRERAMGLSRVRRLLLVLVAAMAAEPAAADRVSEMRGAEAVEAWVRLKGDARGRLTYEWVSGTAFGVPQDAPAATLFRMESVTVRRFQKIAPASYIEKNYSCRLYRDAVTGEFIDEFRNPFTEQDTRLSTRCNRSPDVRYTPESVELLSDMKFESTALGVPMRLERIAMGDIVVIRRDVRTQFLSPANGEMRRELSVDSFTISARAFADQRKTMLAPAYHWESVGGWMAELGMQGRSGRMLWSIFGRSYLSVDDLPADFVAALRARVPDAFERRLD